jgi:hypothetical protein
LRAEFEGLEPKRDSVIDEIMNQQKPDDAAEGNAPPSNQVPPSRKPLSPAAQRALAEAAARRTARDAASTDRPKELQGRGGLDPVRYGDWEKDGLASDF